MSEFFDEVDRLIEDRSSHASVRNLEAVQTAVSARDVVEQRSALHSAIETRTESREIELSNKKNKLIAQFGEVFYIRVAGYRHRVYFEESNWMIRYGRGGSSKRQLTRSEILNGEFTELGDSRIRYE